MENKQERTLAELNIGEKAIVKKIISDGKERRRFFDFGIVPGTTIEALYRSPWKDPTAYQIRGAVIAFREEHAKHIILEEKGE